MIFPVIDSVLQNAQFKAAAAALINDLLKVEAVAFAILYDRPALYVAEAADKVSLFVMDPTYGLIRGGVFDSRPTAADGRWYGRRLAAGLLADAGSYAYSVSCGDKDVGGTVLSVYTNPARALAAATSAAKEASWADFYRSPVPLPMHDVIAQWWCADNVDWIRVTALPLNPEGKLV